MIFLVEQKINFFLEFYGALLVQFSENNSSSNRTLGKIFSYYWIFCGKEKLQFFRSENRPLLSPLWKVFLTEALPGCEGAPWACTQLHLVTVRTVTACTLKMDLSACFLCRVDSGVWCVLVTHRSQQINEGKKSDWNQWSFFLLCSVYFLINCGWIDLYLYKAC